MLLCLSLLSKVALQQCTLTTWGGYLVQPCYQQLVEAIAILIVGEGLFCVFSFPLI